MKVDIYGVYYCTRPAAALMRQQRTGRIINFSSTSGLLGNAGQANYAAAKAGVAGFTRVVARDLGRYGITVNTIAPAAATRLTMSPEMMEARQRRTERAAAEGSEQQQAPGPGGLAEPDDVAPLIVFLATDAAANINGCTFGIAGGLISLHTDPVPVKSIYKDGRWTLDELLVTMPGTLAAGLVNPSPPTPPPPAQ